MAGETTITVVGNLTADPELRFTASGHAVASFTVASTPRTFDRQANEWKDGDSLYLTCNVWRQYAENVAESLTKGMRVIVQGRLKQRSYETREGEKRTVFEVEVDEVGPMEPSSPGYGKAHPFWPFVATAMYLRQICVGNEPPVTEMPCTDFMKVPSG